jgi:hypothetical protein
MKPLTKPGLAQNTILYTKKNSEDFGDVEITVSQNIYSHFVDPQLCNLGEEIMAGIIHKATTPGMVTCSFQLSGPKRVKFEGFLESLMDNPKFRVEYTREPIDDEQQTPIPENK